AYAASVGGMATLIGTPPNIIFAGVIKETFQIEVSFLQWMFFALPFAVVLIFIIWIYLTRFAGDLSTNGSNGSVELEKLPKVTDPEKRVLVVFSLIAFLWMTRSFWLTSILPQVDDTIIAVFGALSLFLIPAGKGDQMLMNWETAKKLP